MDTYKAWTGRKKLSQTQLINLLQYLRDDVVRYEKAIANDPPDRLEKYGKPYLAMLQSRVSDVESLIIKE